MNTITLLSILLTISVYVVARLFSKKYPSPLTAPVFISTIVIIAIFLVSDISYQDYEQATDMISWFLGPATVALAVPLYKNRNILFQHFIPALVGLVIGSLTTICSAVVLAKFFKLTEEMIVSLSIKSITTPVALEVSKIIDGNEALVAGFVIVTGLLGAMFGPWLMNRCKINHPFARGLSIGTITHGIGTSEIAREGEIQGAVAGVFMGLAAVFTSAILPLLLPFLMKI